MAERYLLDTGFLVALVNGKDPRHADCKAVWANISGEFHSVEGVLVEGSWILRRLTGGPRNLASLAESVGTIWEPPTHDRFSRVFTLMDKYRDVPMDFVDASLVVLAERVNIEAVLTLDRRGFSAYRIHGRKKFTLLP